MKANRFRYTTNDRSEKGFCCQQNFVPECLSALWQWKIMFKIGNQYDRSQIDFTNPRMDSNDQKRLENMNYTPNLEQDKEIGRTIIHVFWDCIAIV